MVKIIPLAALLPVFLLSGAGPLPQDPGDTLTVTYEISEIDLARRRSTGDIRVTNQDDTLIAVAKHILQWVPNT